MLNKMNIFPAFYQGVYEDSTGAGNCASIALIKAAIYTFGFEVFEYTLQNDKYSVKLKNDDTVQFSVTELDFAKSQSSFILSDTDSQEEESAFNEILEYAYLCFATICKMVQIHGDYSQRFSKLITPDSFEQAVETINDGTTTPEVYELLGLEKNVSPIYRYKVKQHVSDDCGMVIWTTGHAMFAADGYFDLYGNRTKFKSRTMFRVPGKIFTGVFQLHI
jgi:hypothetical protein